MAVSHTLRRLLSIREKQEEQHRQALESALGELSRLEDTLHFAGKLGQRAREVVFYAVSRGDLRDRLAGAEQARTAERIRTSLAPQIAAAKEVVEERREELLERRLERRQAELLVERAEALDAVVANRREQQALDDWHRNQPAKDAAVESEG